jgi:hypothetical protein
MLIMDRFFQQILSTDEVVNTEDKKVLKKAFQPIGVIGNIMP